MTGSDQSRLTGIFRTVFNRPTFELRDDLSARDVAGWDSLNHVNLIVMIEQEFKVRFSNEEVTTLKDVGHLKMLIDEKQALA